MADNKDSNATKDSVANEDTDSAEDIQVATPYDFSRDDAVTLVVGPEEKQMFVHGTYLTDSDFFRAALKKEWPEGQTRVIKLPEEEPETIAHFMTFFYHGQLPFEDILPTKQGHFDVRWPILIDLYLCGERFLYTPIHDAVITEILRLTRIECPDGSRWFPTRENVDTVYHGTLAGSPMRRLMVDIHVTNGMKDWLWEDANAQFLMDVTKAFYEKLTIHKAFDEFRLKELNDEMYLID